MDSQVLRHFDDTIAAETRLVHNLEQQNMSDERWGVLSFPTCARTPNVPTHTVLKVECPLERAGEASYSVHQLANAPQSPPARGSGRWSALLRVMDDRQRRTHHRRALSAVVRVARSSAAHLCPCAQQGRRTLTG